MSIAELNALYASAASAMASASWESAITYLMQMQARLASTPNVSRQLAGGGAQSIAWNSATIADLIAQCRKNLASSRASANTTGPWQTTKVTYRRVTS